MVGGAWDLSLLAKAQDASMEEREARPVTVGSGGPMLAMYPTPHEGREQGQQEGYRVFFARKYLERMIGTRTGSDCTSHGKTSNKFTELERETQERLQAAALDERG